MRLALFALTAACLACAGIQQRSTAASPAPIRAALEAPIPTVPGPAKDCPALLAGNMACSIGGAILGVLTGAGGLQSLRGTADEPRALPVLGLIAGSLAAGAGACAVYTSARLTAQCQTTTEPP